MEEIDKVEAHTLEPGDIIRNENGSEVEILSVREDEQSPTIIVVETDDGDEIAFPAFDRVSIYGYTSVDI